MPAKNIKPLERGAESIATVCVNMCSCVVAHCCVPTPVPLLLTSAATIAVTGSIVPEHGLLEGVYDTIGIVPHATVAKAFKSGAVSAYKAEVTALQGNTVQLSDAKELKVGPQPPTNVCVYSVCQPPALKKGQMGLYQMMLLANMCVQQYTVMLIVDHQLEETTMRFSIITLLCACISQQQTASCVCVPAAMTHGSH